MNEPVRLIDLGLVTPVRSQTVYHAVAHAMDDATPDTIILVAPLTPYVCIGYHQDLAKEVDLAYCQNHGLPVYRREVGGGAVYLDRNQVFAQWVFQRSHLPSSLEERFALYIKPLVETYQHLGINAYHRPINDIQVAGRKIGGTGAMATDTAEVMVGSLMFDFDTTTMARVLKVASEKMRDKVFQGLQDYMTTMTRELGQAPERAAVLDLYVARCSAALQRPLVAGALNEREEALAQELDERFAGEEWLTTKGGLRPRSIKIHEDVHVVEATHKAPGGLIRVTARLREGRIDDCSLSGDFTVLPASAVGALEEALIGADLQHDSLVTRLQSAYAAHQVQSPGVTPADFATAIMATIQ
ncbi:MAG: lipoate--protein ligase family protein [Chloroflexi bacterium]|nr:lipoate--protein ligase family protein [Chloroflexota bacterium]